MPQLSKGASPPRRVAVLFTSAGAGLEHAPAKVREAEDLTANARQVERVLRQAGHEVRCVAFGEDLCQLASQIKRFKPDIVFNLAEAPGGCYEKEPHAAALLELLGCPYTGNRPMALTLCKDKALTKERLQAHGVPTPRFSVYDHVPEKLPHLSFPLVVKPLRQDGSLGISEESVVDNRANLRRAVAWVLQEQRQEAIVEEFLCGREFNVSLLGNGTQEAPYRVLPPGEYVYHNPRWRVCTFDAKWDENHPSYAAVEAVNPAPLSSKLARLLEAATLQCARLFQLIGYARLDFRLDRRGVPHLIDVNPNPDLAPRMGLARAAETAGLAFPNLVLEILRLGMENGAQ